MLRSQLGGYVRVRGCHTYGGTGAVMGRTTRINMRACPAPQCPLMPPGVRPASVGPPIGSGMRAGKAGVAMLESSHIVAFAAAADLHRARAFYEQVLGLPVAEHNDLAC